jgi:RNA polymerase sigma-70 factor (TIGR02960 family)
MRIGSSGTHSPAMGTSGSKPIGQEETQLADTEARVELHHPENNGIAVSLVWSRHSRRLSVIVEDRKLGASASRNARADNALGVSYHPYACTATQLHVTARARTPRGRRRTPPIYEVHGPAVSLEGCLEQHRAELTAYCCRMLRSPFEAEDAVQMTLFRAWRGFDRLDRFEGRASLRSWLYRIATNVCLDMLKDKGRHVRPMDLGPARAAEAANLPTRAKAMWIEPIPNNALAPDGDPAEVAVTRETIRLAFVAALQCLRARQRAVLLLCEVLRWKATEAAQLLDTTVAAVNSALQRARATLETSGMRSTDSGAEMDDAQRGLLARYVEAFEAYDIDGLTSLIKEDATQSTETR